MIRAGLLRDEDGYLVSTCGWRIYIVDTFNGAEYHGHESSQTLDGYHITVKRDGVPVTTDYNP
jgi:hypothetical protein